MSREFLPADALGGCPSLGQPIVELRKNQAALSLLVNRLFADLDIRRTQLDREAHELHIQRQHLSQQSSAHAVVDGTLAAQCQERLAQAEAELSAAKFEIAEYRERFSAASAAHNQSGDPATLGSDQSPRLNELERDRAELQRSLDAARPDQSIGGRRTRAGRKRGPNSPACARNCSKPGPKRKSSATRARPSHSGRSASWS